MLGIGTFFVQRLRFGIFHTKPQIYKLQTFQFERKLVGTSPMKIIIRNRLSAKNEQQSSATTNLPEYLREPQVEKLHVSAELTNASSKHTGAK